MFFWTSLHHSVVDRFNYITHGGRGPLQAHRYLFMDGSFKRAKPKSLLQIRHKRNLNWGPLKPLCYRSEIGSLKDTLLKCLSKPGRKTRDFLLCKGSSHAFMYSFHKLPSSHKTRRSLRKSWDLIKKINKELKHIEFCQSFLHEWNIRIILEFPCSRYNKKGKKQNKIKTHTQGIAHLMGSVLLEKFVFYLQSFQSHHWASSMKLFRSCS